jgi:hypothetical protein
VSMEECERVVLGSKWHNWSVMRRLRWLLQLHADDTGTMPI